MRQISAMAKKLKENCEEKIDDMNRRMCKTGQLVSRDCIRAEFETRNGRDFHCGFFGLKIPSGTLIFHL